MKLATQKQYSVERKNCSVHVIETLVQLPLVEGGRLSVAETPLNNSELFIRDNYTCLYCGERHTPSKLTKDFIEPFTKQGMNQWTNVVTACLACNRKKAGKTLTEVDMELLAVPYTPSRAERRILKGRNIIADQMSFVKRRKSSNQRVVQTSQRGNCYA